MPHFGDPAGAKANADYRWIGAHYEVWAGDSNAMRLCHTTDSEKEAQRIYESCRLFHPRVRLERHVDFMRIVDNTRPAGAGEGAES